MANNNTPQQTQGLNSTGLTYADLKFYQQKILDAYGVDSNAIGLNDIKPQYYKLDKVTNEVVPDIKKNKDGTVKNIPSYGSLKEVMDAYWASIKKAKGSFTKWGENAPSPHLFDEKPQGAPDTYPFLEVKKKYTTDDIKNINYMHNLIKMLHYRDPTVGASLLSEIRNNELMEYDEYEAIKEKIENYKFMEYEYETIEDKKRNLEEALQNRSKNVELVKADLQRILSRVKRKMIYAVPVEQASIYIDTRRSTFESAYYDVSKFIISTAKFDTDPNDDNHPGTRLQRYHNNLYARAAGMLKKISSKQETINQYRMRQIKREWDHYANMFNYDFTRLPPGYDPIPATNSWITKNNLKFSRMDRCTHDDLLTREWDIEDYLYFDPTLAEDAAGYEAWKVWAEKEKKQYAVLCSEEFEKPTNWELQEGGMTLQGGPPLVLGKLRKFKKDGKKARPIVLPTAPCLTAREKAKIAEEEAEKARLEAEAKQQEVERLRKEAEEAAAEEKIRNEEELRKKEEELKEARKQQTYAEIKEILARVKAATSVEDVKAIEEEIRPQYENIEDAEEQKETVRISIQMKKDGLMFLTINNLREKINKQNSDLSKDPLPGTAYEKLNNIANNDDLSSEVRENATEVLSRLRERQEKKRKRQEKERKEKELKEKTDTLIKSLNEAESEEELSALFTASVSEITDGSKAYLKVENAYFRRLKEIQEAKRKEEEEAKRKEEEAKRKEEEANKKDPFAFAKITLFDNVKLTYNNEKETGKKVLEITNIFASRGSRLGPSMVKAIVLSNKRDNWDPDYLVLSPNLTENKGWLKNYYKEEWSMHEVKSSGKYELDSERFPNDNIYYVVAVDDLLRTKKFKSLCGISSKNPYVDDAAKVDLTPEEYEKIIKETKYKKADKTEFKDEKGNPTYPSTPEAVQADLNEQIEKGASQGYYLYFYRGKLEGNDCITVEKCENTYKARVKKIKEHLKKDGNKENWTVEDNKIVTAEEKRYEINIDGVTKLLEECEDNCERKSLCNAEHPEVIEKYSDKLLKWINENLANGNLNVPVVVGTQVLDLELVSGTTPCCLYKTKKGNEQWWLRTIDGKASDKSQINLLTAMNNNVYKNVASVEYFDEISEEGDANVYYVGENKKYQLNFPKKLKAKQKPKIGTTHVYLQKHCGDNLKSWIEKTYDYEFGGKKNNKQVLKKMNTTRNAEKEKELETIVYGVEKALEEFHSIDGGRFLHRDVKLDNLAFDGEKVCLFDFDNVFDTKYPPKEDCTTIPMKNGTKIMERFLLCPDLKPYLWELKNNTVSRFLDKHQAGMMLLQLGGVFDWVAEYAYEDSPDKPNPLYGIRRHGEWLWAGDFNGSRMENGLQKTVSFEGNPVEDFWKNLMIDLHYKVPASEPGGKAKWMKSYGNKSSTEIRRKRADVFIASGRKLSQQATGALRAERCFNLPLNIVERVFNCFFTLESEMKEGKSNPMCKNYGQKVMSPMQFLSQARQPVFERVQIQSDYGDDEDLDALMEFDPDLDGIDLEKASPRSHISDAEFERMLNESTSYDALSEHIMRENKAYSDHSTDMEIEEDAKSVSSKHSSHSVASVASQMSNMSAHSVASNMSNMSAHSVASNMSAQSAVSVASNLSERSNASTMSNMSNHSYASHHSVESEEAYPTSEHSDQSYGRYSEVSYNNTTGYSNSSGHSSSESSGKEMGYANGLSESSDHGMSESSDHESSNESVGYSSSGQSSSHNHSYNSSSDTDN